MAAVETVNFSKDLSSSNIEPPAKKSEIRETWEFFTEMRTLKFVPILIWSASSLGIYCTKFVPIMCGTM